ncbi:hypothetical protein QCA50_004595 [Cerrena zonata]|uniref:Arylamine N-acetyltransferase n=1 Tax=Cerrena zonata TaxID=2478898 RepID=A0AAW0GMA8_9APHY
MTIEDHPAAKLRGCLWIKKVSSVYSAGQVSNWLKRIGFPGAISDDMVTHFDASLENLSILHRLHLVTFAFENTPMHYSSHHTMDISPEGLYQRLVVEGKGSYCFGMNGLFLQMIRGLGYRAYPGAGRINVAEGIDIPEFISFVHMVIFVQPNEGSNTTYFLDASGGGSGLTRPLPLLDGAEVMGASPTEWHTLVKTARTDSSLSTSVTDEDTPKVEWRLAVSHKKPCGEISSRIMYSFIEDEYFRRDYEFANIGVYSGATGPDRFFPDNVVCSGCFWLTKEEMAEMGAADAYDSLLTRYMGRLGLEKTTLRRHIGSKSETVRTMETEVERAAVLKECFGIEIPEGDLRYIEGRPPAFDVQSRPLQ